MSNTLGMDRGVHESTGWEEQLQLFVEHTPTAIAMFDREMRYLAASRRWREYFRLSDAGLMGRSHYEVFPELPERWREVHRRGLQGEVVRSDGEDVFQRADGESQWLTWEVRPWPAPQGRIGGILIFAEDITAQHRQQLAAAIIEHSDDAVVSKTLDGTVLSWNAAAEAIFGYTAAEMVGHSITRLFPEGKLKEEQSFIDRILAGQEISHFETKRIRKDGSAIDISVTLSPIYDEPGHIVAVSTIARNISERVRLQKEIDRVTQKVAEQNELLRVTLESIGDAVITTDAGGRIQWMNTVACWLTGWLLSEARERPIDQVFRIIDEETRLPSPSPSQRVLAENRVVGLAERIVLVSRDGTERGIQDSAAPIRDERGNVLGIVLVFHDVTEQRRLARETRHRATHDALTGLINRAEFEVRLGRAFTAVREDGYGHALLYIDLDQFKQVNDSCGHSAGDQLLREVASIFRGGLRRRDTLARLGGDEFGVLLEDCSVQQARRVANKLCERMEHFRFMHNERRFRVGASIGLVPIDGRWSSEAEAMQAADAACYTAKEAGRNRVHEWFDTAAAIKERQGEMRWIARLENALDERRFRLYGQQITRCDGTRSGMHIEVLLRLLDTDQSLVAPAVFFPAADRYNLAPRIDRWVLHSVVDWMQAQEIDAIETVAVNLSGQSVGDLSFRRYAMEVISALPFDPGKLCFEITETAAITHLGDAEEFVRAAHKLGVRIALDDFGAGAASFGYLRALPIDFLKIDGHFIRDVLLDRLDRTAVCCFRDIAAVCGVQTVAECVESEDVLAELKRIGIDFAQGYLIHRPEPLSALGPKIARGLNRVTCSSGTV